MECMCGVYVWSVRVECTRGVSVHVECTRGVRVECTHEVYVRVECTCGVYVWSVRVECTCRVLFFSCSFLLCFMCGVVWQARPNFSCE